MSPVTGVSSVKRGVSIDGAYIYIYTHIYILFSIRTHLLLLFNKQAGKAFLLHKNLTAYLSFFFKSFFFIFFILTYI